MRIYTQAGAPTYVTKLARTIEQTCAPLNPSSPVSLPSFTANTLPAASDYAASLVFMTDTDTLAISDGTHWYQIAKGALIK